MVHLFAVLGALISLIFVKTVKGYRSKAKTRTVGFLICKNMLDLILPFTLVSIFYCLFDIALLLTMTSDTISVKTLLEIESYFKKTATAFAPLKLGFTQVFSIVIVLFLLYFIRTLFAFKLRQSMIKGFDTYQRWTTRIYFTLVLLVSFTFFSNDIPSSVHRVSIRISEVKHGYATVKTKIGKIVEEQVYNTIYDKTVQSIPETYAAHLSAVAQLPGKVETLRTRYETLSKTEKVGVDQAEQVITEHDRRKAIVASALRNVQPVSNEESATEATRFIRRPETGSTALKQQITFQSKTEIAQSDIPPQTTMRIVNEVNKKIDEHAKETTSSRKPILPGESGRILTSHLLKSGAWSSLRPILSPVFQEYPILEPLARAIANTAGDVSALAVDNAKESVTTKLFANPNTNVTNTIKSAVDQAIQKAVPRPLDNADNSFRLSIKQLDREQDLISKADQAINRRLVQREADKHISTLYSENEASRVSSANWLYSHRSELSVKQQATIKGIMATGTQKWEMKVGERWEGAYCYKTFRSVSIKDYASLALTGKQPRGESSQTIGYTFTRTYI